MNIIIPYNLINNNNIDYRDINTYILLSYYLFSPYMNENIYIHANSITNLMDKYRLTRFTKMVVNSIEKLISEGFLDAEKVDPKGFIINNTRQLYYCESNYLQLPWETYQQFKEQPYLLKLYLYILINRKLISGEPLVAKINVEKIAGEFNIHPDTIYDHLKELEKAKLLYKVDGIYGDYKDKERINELIELEGAKYLFMTANQKRSLKQKYQNIARGGKYSAAETKKVYEYMAQYNHKLDLLQTKFPKNRYTEQKVDISILT